MSLSELNRVIFNRWGEFLSTEYENNFQAYKWEQNARQIQFVCHWAAIAYASGIVVDFLDNNMLTSTEFWIMASLRLIILLTGIGIPLYISKKNNYFDITNVLSGYMMMFGIAESVSVVIDTRLGFINSDGVDLFVALIFLYYLLTPQRPKAAIIGGWSSSLLYSLTLLTQNTLNSPHFFMNTACLVFFNLFGYFLLVQFGRAQRNEYHALVKEQNLNTQLQTAKSELERYYRLFVNNTIDVIYLYHLTKPVGFQYISPSIKQLTGYEPSDFKDFRQFMRIIHPADRKNFKRIIKRSPLNDGFIILRVLNKKNNDLIWIEHRCSVVDHSGGKAIEGIVRNVTKRVSLEQNIARLDRLNIAGQMAASFAHEIRNPLTTVRGYISFFRNKQYFSPYKDQMDLIINELDRTNSIISDYLTLNKNKTIEIKKCDLNRIIRSLYPLMQTHASTSKITIVLELGEVPELYLDIKEIKKLILNFTRNAIEAMPSGGIVKIRTTVYDNKTILSFKDQGKGIPDYIMQNLGKPFLTTKDFGTGLGMAICYQIISRHHAKLHIDTGTKGTTIQVSF